MSAHIHDNAAWSQATPAISVLIPFLRDDPQGLLRQLDTEAPVLAGAVELVLLDDGTADFDLTQQLQTTINTLRLPARLITLAANEGRARGRNRLTTGARGEAYLFLDSDMRPDTAAFLQIWLRLVSDNAPAVAFGGFSLDQAPTDARFAVHRALSGASECLPASQRALTPEKYVYTSNLLVRRDVFSAESFDPGFSGWGWEDVEWAMRVSRRFPVVHIDNPATHMGLDTVEDLARKFDQGAGNFARVVALHPAIVQTYPSYKAARALKRLPALPLARRLMKQAALTAVLPIKARAFALRLYRAAVYADAV
ncbi:mycofactocin system glycosyltransferase [Brevundimonas vesicularis]|uniref:Mycofactocin system glycosyltransferase n=1 Tax=Brevundimonas vesicularis TaxID=41276 RepID=A0A2X1CF78_BREVE|nr:glycosyltransferase family A protein [Brevundimonas vesicularis]SPU52951.1 mycofactocin system glycosyltransferase [Brevundimonas vesicularis]